jgi:hypothetical protein
MDRTACTEPQCLYKSALYLLYFREPNTWVHIASVSNLTNTLDCLLLVRQTNSSHRDLVNHANLAIRNAVCTAGSLRLKARIMRCGGNKRTFATSSGFCRPYDKDRNLYNKMDPHYRQASAANIHRKCRKAYQQFLHNGRCAFMLYKRTGALLTRLWYWTA